MLTSSSLQLTFTPFRLLCGWYHQTHVQARLTRAASAIKATLPNYPDPVRFRKGHPRTQEFCKATTQAGIPAWQTPRKKSSPPTIVSGTQKPRVNEKPTLIGEQQHKQINNCAHGGGVQFHGVGSGSGSAVTHHTHHPLTNEAPSKTPAITPATSAAQFNCPRSAGTLTKLFVMGCWGSNKQDKHHKSATLAQRVFMISCAAELRISSTRDANYEQ